MKYPERGQRASTNKQKQQADAIRKKGPKKTSASNSGGASVGGGT